MHNFEVLASGAHILPFWKCGSQLSTLKNSALVYVKDNAVNSVMRLKKKKNIHIPIETYFCLNGLGQGVDPREDFN